MSLRRPATEASQHRSDSASRPAPLHIAPKYPTVPSASSPGSNGILIAVRVKCNGCRHEHLVAFSCKRRGFCPSCGARRMIESSAHLVDHVFPEVPVRQWVLSFPWSLRLLFAVRPDVLGRCLAVIVRAIQTDLTRRAGLTPASGAHTGVVTLIQRFGSAVNLNVHLHMLILDGVYTLEQTGPRFHRVGAPDAKTLEQLLNRLVRRIVRRLTRDGLMVRIEGRNGDGRGTFT